MHKILGWTPFLTKNECSDEFYPFYMCRRSAAPLLIGGGWIGTNVYGLYWRQYCVFGVEWRFDSEPSLSIIVGNRGMGLWRPEE